MITRNHATMVHITFMVIIVYTGLLIAWPLSLAQADEGRKQLPPRHPPPSTPAIGDDDRADDHEPPPGAYIELQTQAVPVEAWTGVQWQDQTGSWHEIEGWQGALEADGSKRWWVAARDFSKGPFRWVVVARKGDQPVATSVLFNLPSEAYEVVQVEIALNR